MAGNSVTVDSATQTSDFESDEDPFTLQHKPNSSPRAVIDTSQPFGSVEEAVIRFGGRGFWVPGSILDVDVDVDVDVDADADADAANAIDQNVTEDSDINKLEKRVAAMLKDLQLKEKQTNEILQELDLTKRLVQELKLNVPKESHECRSVSCFGFDKESGKEDSVDSINSQAYNPEEHSDMCASAATKLIMTELKQAKLNLYHNNNELAAIRVSVESLSKKIEKEKSSVNEKGGNSAETTVKLAVNPLIISKELRELNYEADQFMKTAEAAKSEVLRAMSEIDQTKTGLKVVELRWLTAKKLEEAARAAESLALAEMRALSSHENKALGRISLSLEEYSSLTNKTRKAEVSSQPRRDSRLLDSNDFEFMRNRSRPRTKGTTSIGEILSRKLEVRDDLEEGGRVGRERVSLNQMLRRHRGETTSPKRRIEKDGGETKGLFSKRKGLGLVHISFPLSKHGKNKIQALNLW